MEKIDYLKLLLEDIAADSAGKSSLSRIAKKLDVNRSTVMRGLAPYRENGILSEKYQLTDKGDAWCRSTQQRMKRLKNWLIEHQVDEKKAEADAAAVINSCTEEGAMVLSNIGVLCSSCGYRNVAAGKWFGMSGEEFISRRKIQFYENQNMFATFWKEKKENNLSEMSMANDGFERTAVLTKKDGIWMAGLRIKTLEHQSAMGQWFSGIAKTFEFEQGQRGTGVWHEVCISDGEFKLPLSAFWITYRGDLLKLRARLHVRISCSVGPIAMPMGSAYLELRMYN